MSSATVPGANGGNVTSGGRYRPDLDGMRAIAVIAVVLFHFDVTVVPRGFMGVDVFFVLSGYLMARQIGVALTEGRFSLFEFYARRIRRIIPALFAMLAVTTIVAIFVLTPADRKTLGVSLVSATLSFSNILFWRQSGYFAPGSEYNPLLHTWSLAVEEQFYLFFPIGMIVIWRYMPRLLGPLVLLAFVVSLGVAEYGLRDYRFAAVFYLLPTRVWEFLAGGALALGLIPLPRRNWQRQLVSLAGVAAVIAAMLWRAHTPFPGLAALPVCLGTAAVIWAGMTRDDVALPGVQTVLALRLLSFGPLVFVGLISYSLYLWHWPAIVFVNYVTVVETGWVVKAALLVALVPIAWLSWKFIETPFRHGRRVFPSGKTRAAAVALSALLLSLAGGALYAGNGFPGFERPEIQAMSALADDHTPHRNECHYTGRGPSAFGDLCQFGVADGPRVYLFGDSHGVELSYALSGMAEELGIGFAPITASSCPPAFDRGIRRLRGCVRHVKAMVDALTKEPPATIILTAFYSRYEGSVYESPFWIGFEEVAVALAEAGHTLIILGDIPFDPGGTVPARLAVWVKYGRAPENYQFEINTEMHSEIDRKLRDITGEIGATYVPLLKYACGETSRCQPYRDGYSIFFDQHHLSVSMARRVAKDRLIPVLEKTLPGATRAVQ